MLNIDSIGNGIVNRPYHCRARECGFMSCWNWISWIPCGHHKNAKSNKFGRKDIASKSKALNIDLDVLGFIDNNATVCTILNRLVGKEEAYAPGKVGQYRLLQNPLH